MYLFQKLVGVKLTHSFWLFSLLELSCETFPIEPGIKSSWLADGIMAGSSGRHQIGNCTVWTSTRDNWRDVGTQGAWENWRWWLRRYFLGWQLPGDVFCCWLYTCNSGHLDSRNHCKRNELLQIKIHFKTVPKKFPWVRAFALTGAKNPCQIKSLARSTCMHMLILPPTLLYWKPKTQHQDKNGHPKSRFFDRFSRVFFSVFTWRVYSDSNQPQIMPSHAAKTRSIYAGRRKHRDVEPSQRCVRPKTEPESMPRNGDVAVVSWTKGLTWKHERQWCLQLNCKNIIFAAFHRLCFKNYGGQKDGKLCLAEVVCCSISSST